MTVVTPTDRPKSARNRCVIEILVAFFEFSVGIGVFVIGLRFTFTMYMNWKRYVIFRRELSCIN